MEFYDCIAEYYEQIFPVNTAKVSFVLKNISEGDSILDIGCATGELSRLISAAQPKCRIDAIDLDSNMISIAKESNALPLPDYKVMDMSRIAEHYKEDTFDAVMCFGNTLVHLPGRKAVNATLMGIRKVLKKDGVFLLQILNYEHILDKNIKTLPLIDNDRVKFTRTYDFIDDTINFRTSLLIKETGSTLSNSIRLYPLLRKDLLDILSEAGFSSVTLYSSFSMKPFTGNHLPLIALIK